MQKNGLKKYLLVSIPILLVMIIIVLFYMFKDETINTVSMENETTENNIENNTVNNDVTLISLLDAINNELTNQIIEQRQKQKEPEPEPKAKDLIHISSIKTSEPNSVGGVDLYIKWENLSDKTIKYIVFDAFPKNAVGDIVDCEIRRDAEFRGQQTGPVKKGEGDGDTYYPNAWYNNSITDAILMQVDIEYMDGTTAKLSTFNLDEAIY